ncbi:MAG: hypothetical protein EKK54_00135 [Neisseriaceae bacterium]|nr:MAG: hypothetical protein EKK54_00135 [Neisseriaceae bacterium]
MQSKVLDLAQKCDEMITVNDPDLIKNQIISCFEMIDGLLDNNEIGYIYYCIGNLYATLSNHEVQALNSFRLAKRYVSANRFEFYELVCQIETNEANQLAQMGRLIEAISIYYKFINHVKPSEAKIISLIHAVNNLCELWHIIDNKDIAQYYFVKAIIFKRLLLNIENSPHIDAYQKKLISDFLMQHPLQENEHVEDDICALQDTGSKDLFRKSEQQYRTWCLENVLFLNHMNDLVFSYFDAKDTITFPSYATKFSEGCKFMKPHFAIAFANIKREFCFARYLSYEGVGKKYPKFEEKDLKLASDHYNSDYSGKAERLKTSFKLAFGVLDKLVNLLISFLKLDKEKIAKTKNCRTIEFKPKFFEIHLNSFLQSNKYIKALYFVSCELNNDSMFNQDNIKKDVLLGEAKYYKNLRNNLEHNWVHVLEFILDDEQCCEQDYADYIESEQLENDTIKVLKLVRSCIIYLVFAVQLEENNRQSDGKSISLEIPIWGK